MRYQARMEEPSLRSSRIALAGGIAAVLLVGGGGFLLGRATTERAPPAIEQAPVATVAPEPAPAPDPDASPGVLGRSDLLALAARAADGAAAGRAPDAGLGDLNGRRFELRLPFGCDGPAGETSQAAMRWRYDADAQALRINVSPTLWPAAAWWTGSPPPALDAVEGFWIARPWTSSEDCPVERESAGAVGAEPVTLPGQTLAIGQILPADEAREGARDRTAYDAVVRVPEDRLDASKGFRLRISGRVAPMAGGGPVRCQQPLGPEQRPVCLIGVVLDEIAIENPAGGETLATWDVSRRDATKS